MGVSSFFFLFHLIYNTIRMKSDPKSTIEAGRAILGIEFGSTRIKAVLIDEETSPSHRAATRGRTSLSTAFGPTASTPCGAACKTATPTCKPT